MSSTFIRLDRSLLKHRYFDNANILKVWLYLLMKASYKRRSHLVGSTTVELQIGQFIFGRDKAAKDLNMSVQTLRTILKLFQNDKKITIQSTSKFSIITVINFDSYQITESITNHHNNQQLTNNQPATNQQLTTNKNVKKKELYSSDNDVVGEFYRTKRKRKLTGKRLESFNLFWDAFDYKAGKAEAADSWLDIPELTDKIVSQIVIAAKATAMARPGIIAKGITPKMAQGWITDRRWEDELPEPPKMKTIMNHDGQIIQVPA